MVSVDKERGELGATSVNRCADGTSALPPCWAMGGKGGLGWERQGTAPGEDLVGISTSARGAKMRSVRVQEGLETIKESGRAAS